MSAGRIRRAMRDGLFRNIVLGRSVGRWMRLCPGKETPAARALVGGHGVCTDGTLGYGHAARCLAYEPGQLQLQRALDQRRGQR